MTRVPPPAWFFTAIAVMTGLRVFAPGPVVAPGGRALLGLVPVALGVALNLAAVSAFRRHATTTDPEGQPAALVTDGIYARTRNPMYLGGLLILLGFALLLDSLTPFAVPPLYAALAALRFIPPEERRLAMTFGAAYAEYAARVRRWV